RTPRLPGVRISKSRSFNSMPNASRASLRASSTDLPVNSWYSLMSASSPSSALTAPLAGADRLLGRGLLVRVVQDRRALGRLWRWRHGHGESRGMPERERGRPAEHGEGAAPTHDEVLLDDRAEVRRG